MVMILLYLLLCAKIEKMLSTLWQNGIMQVNDNIAAVFCFHAPDFGQTDCFLVKFKAFFQIGDVKIKMFKLKIHTASFLVVFLFYLIINGYKINLSFMKY